MSRKAMIRTLIVLAVVVVGIFAFAGLAWASTGHPGPNVPTVSDPVNQPVNEVQLITFTDATGTSGANLPTGGTFTLSFGSSTTTALANNASASAVQTALNKLQSLGGSGTCTSPSPAVNTCTVAGSNIVVTGGPGGYMITFVGALGGSGQGWVTIDGSLLTGPGAPYRSGNGVELAIGSTSGASDISPHGGYSASTDYCLQCHAVHGGVVINQGNPGTSPNFNYVPQAAPGINSYALLAQQSVTQVCDTCHSTSGDPGAQTTLGVAGPVPQDGGGLGRSVGTASVRAAYDTPNPASEHTIGSAASTLIPLGSGATCYDDQGATAAPSGTNPSCPVGYSQITQGGWSYGMAQQAATTPPWLVSHGSGVPDSNEPAGAGTASAGGGGLYCASCHTPHGDWGQAVNTKWVNSADFAASPDITTTKVRLVANNTPVYIGRTAYYLEQSNTGASKGIWFACSTQTTPPSTIPVPGASVNGCQTWTMTDANGNPGIYLYGYKLLSAFPNHTYGDAPRSYNANGSYDDQAEWCGTCHTDAVDTSLGGSYHNHPTGCTYCHGGPSVLNTSSGPTNQDFNAVQDYPHTSSNAMLLKALPDGLCISCHSKGSLP
jgi:hypothetical protein